MGMIDKGVGQVGSVSLGSLTTTGANESLRATPHYGLTTGLTSMLQGKGIGERVGPGETWVPLGIAYVITTGITVTAAVVTLAKNGTNAATGGTATLPIAALGPNEIFVQFSPWTFAAADASGDVWSIKVTTTSTAGVITSRLIYAVRAVIGVAVGVAY